VEDGVTKYHPPVSEMKELKRLEMSRSTSTGSDIPPNLPQEEAHHLSHNETWSAFFGQTLQWNVMFCVLGSLFDSEFKIQKRFSSGHAGADILRRRFRVMGFLNLILMPFILIFMVIYFFLKHAEEFHRRRDILGQREWTPLAKWKFREYNELELFFQERLKASHEPASKFVGIFPSAIEIIIAQFVAYVSGSFVAVLLVMAFLDSSILIHLSAAGRPLIWWLTIFSLLLAVSRSFIPPRNMTNKSNEVMKDIVAYTHFMPEHWKGRCHTRSVIQEFEFFYRSKISMLLLEIVSVFTTPFVLLFTLPNCSERIVWFIQNFTTDINGVGDVCSYALFDLEHFGDPAYLAPGEEGSDKTRRGSRREAPSKFGKMEKSLLSFSINHPDWHLPEDASRFLVNVASVDEVERLMESEELDPEEAIQRSMISTNPSERSVILNEMSRSDRHLIGSFSELLKNMKPSQTLLPPDVSVVLIISYRMLCVWLLCLFFPFSHTINLAPSPPSPSFLSTLYFFLSVLPFFFF